MNEIQPEQIDELQAFLDEIEALAPTRDEITGSQVVYRSVSDETVIDDSLPTEAPIEEGDDEWSDYEESDTEGVYDFQLSESGPLAAVDCGIVRLGETENGLVIALRATLVIEQENSSQIKTYRTGPIYLHNRYKPQILHQMGEHLGKPDFFVELGIDEANLDAPEPVRVKKGVADDAHQYGDRFRNWLERLVQRIAVSSIENGVVLFDGALTLRTRDTPSLYLEDLARLASNNGNAIIAISKQSRLQIQEKSIQFWLNDVPNRACYRYLTSMMRREDLERVLGNAYAARLSVLGPTFRVDVKPVEGQSDDEAIDQFFSSALMRGGYPDILVRAHTFSYFTSPDVTQLQAQAGAMYSLTPQNEVEFTGIFGPFGGRFK